MALLSAFNSALVFCGCSLLSPPAPDGFSSLLGTCLSPLPPMGCKPAFCCCGNCSGGFCFCLSCFLLPFCCLPPLPCCWPFVPFGWPCAFTNSNCIYWGTHHFSFRYFYRFFFFPFSFLFFFGGGGEGGGWN